MVTKISITVRDHTAKKIQEKKGGLNQSEYIEECLHLRWEHEKIKEAEQ